MVADRPVCLNRNFLMQSRAAQTGSSTDSLFRLPAALDSTMAGLRGPLVC
jgi:hypothetical protein